MKKSLIVLCLKTKRRFNWLLLNLFTALLATWVISFFGASIEQMVALAFLMPIVASMGGNAGMQTLAVTIRAIATKELSKSNFNRVVGKEFLIGILNGIIFAIITAIIVQLWFKELNLSLINWYFNDFKYDCCRIVWNFSSSIIKKIKY